MKRRNALLSAALLLTAPWVDAALYADAAETPLIGETYDVVIVGAGIAGLAAAVSAKEAGAARVLVLEKGPIVGGHSVFASGSLAFVDPKRQLEGVEDSVDLFIKDARTVGGNIDEAMVRKVAQDSGAVLNWIESMGVKLSNIPYTPFGGLRARCISAQGNAGARHYIARMNSRAIKLGVRVMTLSPVTALEKADGGWQVSFEAQGKRSVSVVSKTVVLATGGFSANLEMRQKYFPSVGEDVATTANPRGTFFEGAMGEGHMMARKLGAQLVNMNAVLYLPYWGGRLLDSVGGEIYTDMEGRRFIDETRPTRAIAEAVANLPERSFWVISDSQTAKGANFGLKLSMGGIHKSDTIEEMALGMNVAPAVLKKTLEDYNASVKAGKDVVFGRKILGLPLEKPPFYWGREKILIHGTLGGVKADPMSRVLDEKGQPIQGLFAAGEIVGGVWGHDRLGGAALTAGLVQGREAGKQAAQMSMR